MDDEPDKKRDWAIVFLIRLCAIAWISMILFETVDRVPLVRQICIFLGPWACVIALLHALGLLLIRRQGIFFIFFLIVIPPSIDFGIVLTNIANQKNWFKTPAATASDRKEGESPTTINHIESPTTDVGVRATSTSRRTATERKDADSPSKSTR